MHSSPARLLCIERLKETSNSGGSSEHETASGSEDSMDDEGGSTSSSPFLSRSPSPSSPSSSSSERIPLDPERRAQMRRKRQRGESSGMSPNTSLNSRLENLTIVSGSRSGSPLQTAVRRPESDTITRMRDSGITTTTTTTTSVVSSGENVDINDLRLAILGLMRHYIKYGNTSTAVSCAYLLDDDGQEEKIWSCLFACAFEESGSASPWVVLGLLEFHKLWTAQKTTCGECATCVQRHQQQQPMSGGCVRRKAVLIQAVSYIASVPKSTRIFRISGVTMASGATRDLTSEDWCVRLGPSYRFHSSLRSIKVQLPKRDRKAMVCLSRSIIENDSWRSVCMASLLNKWDTIDLFWCCLKFITENQRGFGWAKCYVDACIKAAYMARGCAAEASMGESAMRNAMISCALNLCSGSFPHRYKRATKYPPEELGLREVVTIQRVVTDDSANIICAQLEKRKSPVNGGIRGAYMKLLTDHIEPPSLNSSGSWNAPLQGRQRFPIAPNSTRLVPISPAGGGNGPKQIVSRYAPPSENGPPGQGSPLAFSSSPSSGATASIYLDSIMKQKQDMGNVDGADELLNSHEIIHIFDKEVVPDIRSFSASQPRPLLPFAEPLFERYILTRLLQFRRCGSAGARQRNPYQSGTQRDDDDDEEDVDGMQQHSPQPAAAVERESSISDSDTTIISIPSSLGTPVPSAPYNLDLELARGMNSIKGFLDEGKVYLHGIELVGDQRGSFLSHHHPEGRVPYYPCGGVDSITSFSIHEGSTIPEDVLVQVSDGILVNIIFRIAVGLRVSLVDGDIKVSSNPPHRVYSLNEFAVATGGTAPEVVAAANSGGYQPNDISELIFKMIDIGKRNPLSSSRRKDHENIKESLSHEAYESIQKLPDNNLKTIFLSIASRNADQAGRRITTNNNPFISGAVMTEISKWLQLLVTGGAHVDGVNNKNNYEFNMNLNKAKLCDRGKIYSLKQNMISRLSSFLK